MSWLGCTFFAYIDYLMADAPLTYGIVIGVFIGLGVILFAARAKRYSSKRVALLTTSNLNCLTS
jgi:hypothetical protein